MKRTERRMATVPARISRLELVIIVAALVVLLFNRQPPKPGNADIRSDAELTTKSPQDPISLEPSELLRSQGSSEPPLIQPGDPGLQTPPNTETDNLTLDSIPQPQPRPKRYAMVDARNCDSLKYPNVMYGEIAVRWVWDGTRFVPRKVCVVTDDKGIASVWSFDELHEGVTLTEVPADEVPMN
ncbi:MAG: hypothetical protein ACM3VT_15410 [Solirubrobacterales bacterium]